MSLLKIGGEWKIVNKVFSADKRNAAQEARKQILNEWSIPFEPRKILGNVYYVGTNLISSFLIVTAAEIFFWIQGRSKCCHKSLQTSRSLAIKCKTSKSC